MWELYVVNFEIYIACRTETFWFQFGFYKFCKTGKAKYMFAYIYCNRSPKNIVQSLHLHNDIWVFLYSSRSTTLIFEWIELIGINWFNLFGTDWFQDFSSDVGRPPGYFLWGLWIFWRPVTPLDSNFTVSRIWQLSSKWAFQLLNGFMDVVFFRFK